MLDRSFVVEMAFIEAMNSGEGVKMLMQEVTLCLPSPSVPMTTEVSLRRLSSLVAKPLYEFVNKTAQAEANFMKKAVQSMHLKRRPPALDAGCSPTLSSTYALLANFCSTVVPGDTEGAEQTLYGKSAIDVLFDAVKAKEGRGDALSTEDLSIGRFFFALSAAQNALLKEWCSRLLPTWDGDKSAGADDEQGACEHKAKKARLETQVDKEVDNAFM